MVGDKRIIGRAPQSATQKVWAPWHGNAGSIQQIDRVCYLRPMRTKTGQESFWEGSFGDEYTSRNRELYAGYQDRRPFFEELLRRMTGVRSVCELGANGGQNLETLRTVDPSLELTGVEINGAACEEMRKLPGVTAVQSSIQDYVPGRKFDWVFTCGVLIHVNPDDLPAVYRKLVDLSNRYVLVNEYYNPRPQEIDYRGHTGRLFKRDFAGELLDTCPDLELVDYGFLWKRRHPAWDNTTWFLLERR